MKEDKEEEPEAKSYIEGRLPRRRQPEVSGSRERRGECPAVAAPARSTGS